MGDLRSKRFRPSSSRKLGREQNEEGKETLTLKPHDSEKCERGAASFH